MYKNLVRVIIPTYNRSAMLIKAVESVTKQTYKNLEIIIIDDGSTDGTKKIVQEMKDKRIKYFNKINSGPAESRNLGIKKSKGKLIAFLDDDDTFSPQKIQKQVQYLASNKNLAFCYTNSYLLLANKKYKYINKKPDDTYLSLLLKKNYLVCSSIVVRKNILLKNKLFQKEYEPLEDYELWTRIAKNHRFGLIDLPLYSIRWHNTNITKNVHKVIFNNSRIRYNHLSTYSQPVTRKLQNEISYLTKYYDAMRSYYEDEIVSARNLLIKLIKTRPLNPILYIFFLQTFFPRHTVLNLFYQLYFIFMQEKVSTI